MDTIAILTRLDGGEKWQDPQPVWQVSDSACTGYDGAFIVIPKRTGLLLRFAVLFSVMAGVSSCASALNGASEHRLEESLCGLKEPFVFWLWSRAAGSADHSRALLAGNVEDVSLTTVDGRRIRGYKLSPPGSTEPPAKVEGYLLVAQGNAMLADQIISSFKSFARMGYDVYIFDYRGYGRSEGKRRLKAILSDYREIIAHLNALSYPRRLYYGMSFGGIVLLDALKASDDEKSVVIDSTPSRLSTYGCPPAHDPVNNLPRDSSDFLFISGDRDPVVSFNAQRELLELARQSGAAVLRDPQFSHPFMDTSMEAHNRRRRAVERFLLGGHTEQP